MHTAFDKAQALNMAKQQKSHQNALILMHSAAALATPRPAVFTGLGEDRVVTILNAFFVIRTIISDRKTRYIICRDFGKIFLSKSLFSWTAERVIICLFSHYREYIAAEPEIRSDYTRNLGVNSTSWGVVTDKSSETTFVLESLSQTEI